MTGEQWLRLGEAFHKWPFKPDVLEDETRYSDEGRVSLDDTDGYEYAELETTTGIDEILDDEDEGEAGEYEDIEEIEDDKDEMR